jgi:acyl carrier protein
MWNRAVDDIGSAGGPGSELLRAEVRARWADALAHDRFDDDADFFDVGGHSLMIAEIMAGLGALAGTRLPLRLFFDNPTVNELTAALAAYEVFASVAR